MIAVALEATQGAYTPERILFSRADYIIALVMGRASVLRRAAAAAQVAMGATGSGGGFAGGGGGRSQPWTDANGWKHTPINSMEQLVAMLPRKE